MMQNSPDPEVPQQNRVGIVDAFPLIIYFSKKSASSFNSI